MATTPEQNNKNLWIAFGQKVRERREQIDITQDVAAQRAGMVRQRWIQIEQGQATKRVTVEKIAGVLELDPGVVLRWAGFQSPDPPPSEPPPPATQVISPPRIESTTKVHAPTIITSVTAAVLDLLEKLPESRRHEVLRFVLDLYDEENKPKRVDNSTLQEIEPMRKSGG